MTPGKAPDERDALNRWIGRHPMLAVLILLAFIAIGLTFRYLKTTT
jgi:hypothetical protein